MVPNVERGADPVQAAPGGADPAAVASEPAAAPNNRATPVSIKNKLQGLIGKEFKWIKKLRDEDLCKLAADTTEGVLNGLWKNHSGKFIYLCNHNTSAANLFSPSLSKAEKKNRIEAYCSFKPVFRLCMVCGILRKTAADLEHAYGQCGSYLESEDHGRFETKVLGKP